jgi:hypothetical protein
MKALLQPNSYGALIALCLKLTGIILILIALIDLIFAAVPPDFLNPDWLSNLLAQWVGQGIGPMMGLAVLFLGIWLGAQQGDRLPLRLLNTSLMVCGLLGVLFLLLVPLHFNSSRLASAAATRTLNQEALAAEQDLKQQLSQRRELARALLADPARQAELKRQLEQDDLSESQRAQLQTVKAAVDRLQADPKRLDQDIEAAFQEGMSQIQAQQQAAQNQFTGEMRELRLRVSLTSLLLSAGYLSIAWTGFGLGKQRQPKMRRARAK